MSPFVSLVGWLLVSMCACVFLSTLRHIFMSFSHCFSCTLGGPCDSIVTLGAHFATLGDLFLHVFRTWWDLGAQFVDLWAPFGHLWGPFWCVFVALWPDPGPLFGFSGNASKKSQKRKEKGN